MYRDPPPRFLPAGDTALVVEFGSSVDPALIAAVQALDRAVAAAALPGVVETVPSFRSLMIHYDPLVTSAAALAASVAGLDRDAPVALTAARRWRLPCCYEGEFAPDLASVAVATGLSAPTVIDAHRATEFTVAMLGFLPGCPFLAGLDAAFDLPRRAVPRTRVPAGSVAVAQKLSVIYPAESPGGWHLIGRCPVPLFDPARAVPALLAPGDLVGFFAIGAADYERLVATADDAAAEYRQA
ncbi:MAG: hypothetical protein QOJ54_372 [Aliidongia sp.]|nr:hypothetical protein [Aliidongia sp.]